MENERNQCRKCGGEGKPSKGYMNFHNVQTTDLSKEFETKLLDCIKCSSCGHSWIPLKSTSELALERWNKFTLEEQYKFTLEEQFYKVISWLKAKGLNVTDRHPHSLTGKEIEEIWVKETQYHTKDSIGNFFISSIESQNTIKPNQKQFKEFNPELFKAYIDKFSDNDILEAYNIIEGKVSDIVNKK